MRVNIPASETKSGFELVKPGQYELKILKVTEGKGPKGPYLKFELEIMGATTNADGNPITGSVGHVYDIATLAAEKRWRLSDVITAAGFDPQDCDTEELQGAVVVAQLEIEADPGYAAKNVVKKYIKK